MPNQQTNPPLVVTHDELIQLDQILDKTEHGFAKQIIGWVGWVRNNRNSELQQQREKLAKDSMKVVDSDETKETPTQEAEVQPE
jgi:hypothetical protein